MDLSKERVAQLTNKLKDARTRLLVFNGFFGMLLMSMKFRLDDSCEVIYTTVTHIGINPDFLGGCTDNELDYVLMHEIMHLVLKHPFRGPSRDKLFNYAADVVVNSHILSANGESSSSITLFGEEQPHTFGDDKEGRDYSVDEVYDILKLMKYKVSESDMRSDDDKGYPDEKSRSSGGDGDEDDDRSDTSDSDGNSASDGFQDSITGVCESKGTFDDHSRWEPGVDKALQESLLNQKIMDAYEANKCRAAGSIPDFVERIVDELTNPTVDWRTILNDFVQEEIVDYSFVPPDTRMQDSPFILPGFNDPDEKVDKILFMVDTSGSMTIEEITDCYSEIKGAIEQFDGKLSGMLGFFDCDVKKVVPFEEGDNIEEIKPIGGGGTSFECVFDYIRDNMEDDLPKSIIILTDGFATFPKEKAALGIPVLWVVTNNEVAPPWGKHVVITKNTMN